MASPIFVSEPNPNFSLIAILKGAQLALLGTHRLLQSQRFFENPRYFKFTVFTIYVSVVLRCVTSVPSLIVRSLRLSTELQEAVSHFIDHIINVPTIALLILHCMYNDVFDEIFLDGLKFIDEVSGKGYCIPLQKCSKIDYDLSWSSRLLTSTPLLSGLQAEMSIHQRTHLGELVASSLAISLRLLALLICSRFLRFGGVAVSIYVSWSFANKIGSSFAFVAFVVGCVLPAILVVDLYSFFVFSVLTVRTLLSMSYFQRLRLSEVQVNSWIESRIGLIFGFGLVFNLISSQLSYISFLVLMFEQLGLAFLIFKLTDPAPGDVTAPEPWILTQTYWKRRYTFSDLLDINSDGFTSLHGSYMFSPSMGPKSTGTSGLATPRQVSAIDLQKLTINTVH